MTFRIVRERGATQVTRETLATFDDVRDALDAWGVFTDQRPEGRFYLEQDGKDKPLAGFYGPQAQTTSGKQAP